MMMTEEPVEASSDRLPGAPFPEPTAAERLYRPSVQRRRMPGIRAAQVWVRADTGSNAAPPPAAWRQEHHTLSWVADRWSS
jgi:hypothetical protein